MATQHVLIVDDDQALARALRIRCQEHGLSASVSSDALHALMLMVKEPPDLAIIDVNMPHEDGLTLCEWLAKDQRLAPVPVIVLTGRSDEATMVRCRELGAHYVYKGSDVWERMKPVLCELLESRAANIGHRAPSPSRAPSAEGPAAERTRPTVLVIDDDPAMALALEIRLRPHGIDVLRAFNGMQGYWMALKETPDAIIMDYVMPEGYGDYVIDRLQRHSLTKEIPVIAVTGRGRDYALQRRMFNLGVSACLAKPLDFHALLFELRQHIYMNDDPRLEIAREVCDLSRA